MAYRGDDAGDAIGVVEAQTSEGVLRAELAPRHISLSIATRTMQIVEQFITLTEGTKTKATLKITGPVFIARDVPREDLGVWTEIRDDKGPGMRRIFGVEPFSLMTAEGLEALVALDKLAARLKLALGELTLDVRRAIELGRGLDKVVFVEHGDRTSLYARRLFRDRARLAVSIFRDGRVEIPDGKTVRKLVLASRYGVTILGDYLRFTDQKGAVEARVSVPWIATEDRLELIRRIGNLVDGVDSPNG